jgi:hypothetical protein
MKGISDLNIGGLRDPSVPSLCESIVRNHSFMIKKMGSHKTLNLLVLVLDFPASTTIRCYL